MTMLGWAPDGGGRGASGWTFAAVIPRAFFTARHSATTEASTWGSGVFTRGPGDWPETIGSKQSLARPLPVLAAPTTNPAALQAARIWAHGSSACFCAWQLVANARQAKKAAASAGRVQIEGMARPRESMIGAKLSLATRPVNEPQRS